MELPIVGIVTVSVSVAMMPNLVAMGQEGKMMDALHTWQEATRKCSFIIFACFAFCLAFGRDLMVLLYGQDYSLASWPFLIYLCRLPIRVAIYATLFRASGQTGPIAKGAMIALVVNVIVSTALVILGGKSIVSFVGPAVGTVVASLASWSYLLWQLSRTISVPLCRIMRWKELGLILLICVVCGLFVLMLPVSSLPLLVRLTVRAASYFVLIFAAMLTTGILKEDERQMLLLPWNFVKKRIL
jgi:O-antigen/teichoic acid export membrane protein